MQILILFLFLTSIVVNSQVFFKPTTGYRTPRRIDMCYYDYPTAKDMLTFKSCADESQNQTNCVVKVCEWFQGDGCKFFVKKIVD